MARRRGLLVLVGALLILAIVLGWWQAHDRAQGKTAPIDRMILELQIPSQRLATSVRNQLTASPQYAVDPLTPVGTARLQALETENSQLRELLKLQTALPTGIAAEVIGRDLVPGQGYLELDKGSEDGVTPQMVVLTPNGVLGQVAAVTAHSAQVMLLNDRASGIGALIDRSKALGVVKGFPDGSCRMIYLSGQADIKSGDAVITSGLGRIYPKGLPLGSVTAVTRNLAISSRVASLTPAADPATADFVLVAKW